MIYLLYTLHVLLCLFLILVVLLQQGKGADLSVFGGGSTMAAFGARSATNLLHRLTVGAFVGFVFTTISIAFIQGHVEGSSVMQGLPTRRRPPPPRPRRRSPPRPPPPRRRRARRRKREHPRRPPRALPRSRRPRRFPPASRSGTATAPARMHPMPKWRNW